MRRLTAVLIICFLSFPPPALTAEEGHDAYRVAGVVFEGVEQVPKKELSATLATRPPSFWKFWKKKPVLAEEDFAQDLLRIEQFYQARGYYRARATYRMETLEEEKDKVPRVRVIFSVIEADPAIIQRIDWNFRRKLPEVPEEKIPSSVPIRTGEIFRSDGYQQSKTGIRDALGNLGYPLAEVRGQAEVNVIENSVQISFDIEPGEKYNFGEISISGNDGYLREEVIHRALMFKPGETYATDKVEQSQRNLFNLSLFKTALIRPGQPDPDADAVPMEVQVVPRKRQNVELGLGYGNEDGFRARGGWTYRNLMGWGGNFSLNAKRSDLIETLQAGYSQPYFLDARSTVNARGGYEREIQDSFTNRKVFAGAGFNRHFFKNWSWTAGYNLEVSRLEDVNVVDPVELARLQGESDFFISSVEMGLIRKTVDNELNPTRGEIASLSVEQASTLIGSEVSFFRPVVEYRRFLPFPRSMVLAGRLRMETILKTEETDNIPIFKRIFLGGANTVRGYGFRALGPQDENGNPLGGLSGVTGNLELRYPLYGDLGGVVFMDMGLLDAEAFYANFADLRYTAGLGVRYNTLIGPVRIDVGYKLNPPTRQDVGLQTNSEEEFENRWQVHFSIGQAF